MMTMLCMTMLAMTIVFILVVFVVVMLKDFDHFLGAGDNLGQGRLFVVQH